MTIETKHNCPTHQRFDDDKGQCVDNDIKRDVKKNCPTDMIFSKNHGRCIQPDLESVDGAENPNARSKAKSPLVFPTHKKRGDIQKI